MPTAPPTDSLLTREEAAGFLKLKPQTLANWATRRVGPAFIRVGGRAVRYRRADLESFLTARTVQTAAPAPSAAA